MKKGCVTPINKGMQILENYRRPEPKIYNVSFTSDINEMLKDRYKIFDSQKPRVDYPQFPANVHEAHLDEIGRLQAEYTSWANYIDELLAIQIGDSTHDDDQKDFAETLDRLQTDGTFHKKKDQAKVSKDTRQKYEKSLQTSAMVELLKAKLRSCERALKSLSRELSRRGLQVQIDS